MARRAWRVVLVLSSVLLRSTAAAHDLPLDTTMNAFVKIEAQEAHLVVRVPLDLLHSVQFPVHDHQYDLAAAGPAMDQALRALAQSIVLWEDGERLAPSSSAGRLALPSDRSFASYSRAAAHVRESPDPMSRIYFDQGFLDARFTYPISRPSSVFTIQTSVGADLRNLVRLSVRYLPATGGTRALLITPTSGRVPLNPAWYQAARGFVGLGIEHILSGIDHLLFLLCLVLPFRRLRSVIPVVTAFTVAHSFTLIGAAYHLGPAGSWFPPFVETAIAASIVYMAIENVAGVDLRRRWLVTGLFGLVHGFGFSQGLENKLQFAGSHLVVSLLSFNVGIELGQIAVLAVAFPVLVLVRRVMAERTAVIVVSVLAAHSGWHWMTERWQVLAQVGWPDLDASSVRTLGPWAAGIAIVAVAVLSGSRWVERRWHGGGERSRADQVTSLRST